ncbi:MAG: oligosaccharide flippase family protein [Muribaculaceae bacterium]|nr:oligosaccharide flippase family protein [Muribaculaceae bacterium]
MVQTEKVKKTSVGREALFLTGSRFLVSILGLITSMLLARFRTLDEYGTYSQILMVTDLVTSILLLGIPNSINYFLAKADSDEERRYFLSVYSTVCTILTIVIGICLYLTMPLIIRHFSNPLIRDFAYVFAVYPWSTLFIHSIGNICVVYGKSNRLIIYNVINAIVVLIVLLIAKLANMSFHQYMLMYMAVLMLFAIAAIIWSHKISGGIRIKLDFEMVKDIFVFSIPIGLSSVVGTLNGELDKLVIGRFFSVDEYAIFANAAKELPVTMVAVSITTVLLPQLVRMLKKGSPDEAVNLWSRAIELSLCFMCLVVGGFIVFAPDLISMFYSEKYVTEGSVAVFRIYSCILIFRVTYWGIILNATGNTKFILYSSLLTLLFNFVGNIASYYLLGFIGPAISTLVVTIIMCYVQLKFTTRVIKIPFSKIFPWRGIGRLLLISVGFCVVFGAVKYLLLDHFERTTSILISIGLGILWAVFYALINLKFVKHSWQLLNAHKYDS